MKVLSLGHGIYAAHRYFGEPCYDIQAIFKSPEDISLVVLPGGADIHPSLYGHEEHKSTYASITRDRRELSVFVKAQEHGIPVTGICRGAQMLTALAGGYLYQDVTGHHRDHLVTTYNGKTFNVTSCHHQMFGEPLPYGSVPLMWTTKKRSSHYMKENIDVKRVKYEMEGVWYPNINSIAIQWHPEWMSEDSAAVTFYRDCLEKFVRPLARKKTISVKA